MVFHSSFFIYYYARNLRTNQLTRTIVYAYNNSQWCDKLTAYNGKSIVYDYAGNPLSYRGATLTWQNGRQLATHARGGITTTFNYDHSGKRTHKNSTRYFWQGSKLLAERRAGDGSPMYYYYDESGVCGMRHNNQDFYFQKNVLGDVLAVYNTLGQLQARYTYDAWGNHEVRNASGVVIARSDSNEAIQSNHIGLINPWRYRGYYFDNETGLYYLSARYYDPVTHRFINADDAAIAISRQGKLVGGINMFAYCGNNPIDFIDETGNSRLRRALRRIVAVATLAVTAVASVGLAVAGAALIATGVGAKVGTTMLGAGIGGLVGTATGLASSIRDNDWSNERLYQIAFNGVMGAATGALMASPLGGLTTGLAVGGVSAVRSIGNDLFDGNRDAEDIIGRALVHGAVGGVLAGVGKTIMQAIPLPGISDAGRGGGFALVQNAIYKSTKPIVKNATTGIRTLFSRLINRLWASN